MPRPGHDPFSRPNQLRLLIIIAYLTLVLHSARALSLSLSLPSSRDGKIRDFRQRGRVDSRQRDRVKSEIVRYRPTGPKSWLDRGREIQ